MDRQENDSRKKQRRKCHLWIKKSRFRAEINNQQVQIYCIRQFEDVSAKIIVIGTQKNQVERTLNQLIEGYKN